MEKIQSDETPMSIKNDILGKRRLIREKYIIKISFTSERHEQRKFNKVVQNLWKSVSFSCQNELKNVYGTT